MPMFHPAACSFGTTYFRQASASVCALVNCCRVGGIDFRPKRPQPHILLGCCIRCNRGIAGSGPTVVWLRRLGSCRLLPPLPSIRRRQLHRHHVFIRGVEPIQTLRADQQILFQWPGFRVGKDEHDVSLQRVIGGVLHPWPVLEDQAVKRIMPHSRKSLGD